MRFALNRLGDMTCPDFVLHERTYRHFGMRNVSEFTDDFLLRGVVIVRKED